MDKIDEYLYAGQYEDATNLQLLQDEMIYAIVSLTNDEFFPNKFVYMLVDIADAMNSKIINHFDSIYSFINLHIINKKRVLVHCNAGVSRTGAIIVAYLIKKYIMSYEEALKYAQTKRPKIQPNNSFEIQLINYQFNNNIKRTIPKIEVLFEYENVFFTDHNVVFDTEYLVTKNIKNVVCLGAGIDSENIKNGINFNYIFFDIEYNNIKDSFICIPEILNILKQETKPILVYSYKYSTSIILLLLLFIREKLNLNFHDSINFFKNHSNINNNVFDGLITHEIQDIFEQYKTYKTIMQNNDNKIDYISHEANNNLSNIEIENMIQILENITFFNYSKRFLRKKILILLNKKLN